MTVAGHGRATERDDMINPHSRPAPAGGGPPAPMADDCLGNRNEAANARNGKPFSGA